MEVELINTGFWSLVPPILALVLAVITKEVYMSLFVGVLSGVAIYTVATDASFADGVVTTAQLLGDQIAGNAYMVLFLSLLGSLVVVITLAGGSRAYGDWAVGHIKNARVARIMTALLGVVIFIDDYFNCLTVGAVMRPVTDKFGISHAKMAYIIDSTAAPVCIIAPISSWAVAVGGFLGDGGFSVFLQTIPFNMYALLTLCMVAIVCWRNEDWGPMAKAQADHENILKESQDAVEEINYDGEPVSEKGRVIDLILPLAVLIVVAIFAMLYVGGYFTQGVSFAEAVGTDPVMGLCVAVLAALVIAAFMYIPRKLMTLSHFMDGVGDGIKQMANALMILVLAWSLGALCRYMIGTGLYVSGIVEYLGVGLNFLPAFIFLIAALLAVAMGTSWGTMGLLIPIVVSIYDPSMGSIYVMAVSATLAGAIYGDHISPISDTTILSSTGADCNHLLHVATQIPYATMVAVICFITYIVGGFITNPLVMFVIGLVLLIAGNYVAINRERNKKLKAANAQA